MLCVHCKKKSHVILQCKCEKFFCVKHQLPEKHECTYNYEKHTIDKMPLSKKIELI